MAGVSTITAAGLDPTSSQLVEQFREFYAELMNLKRRRAAWQVPSVPTGDEEPLDQASAAGAGSLDIDTVAHRLAMVLERQSKEAGRLGGHYGEGLYREAQYLMAALADEICIHDMPGGHVDAWTPRLLERRLFGTWEAGEEVFVRIERLLSGHETVNPELAVVYLMALALGFQGRYRGRGDGGEIARLKVELHKLLFSRTPEIDQAGKRVSNQPYQHTVHHADTRPVPHLRRWLLAIAGAIVTLLVVGQVLWWKATGDLTEVLTGLPQAPLL